MIVDRIDNAAWYGGLPSPLVRALAFLRDTDVLSLTLGRHDLDGDRLFALVQEYTTRDVSQCRWEAHRKYCDVQFVARGVERIDVGALADMEVTEAYDATKEVAFFADAFRAGGASSLVLRDGMFAIFAPQDVHRPCSSSASPSLVRKIVIKAQLE